MPASTADPVTSVLKNAFAFNVSGRNENGAMHSVGTGLIRGGSSNSILSSNGAFDDEPSNYVQNGTKKSHSGGISMSANSSMNSSPVLENSIRANAKKLLISAQHCNVEFDEPTRHISGMNSNQPSSNNISGINSTNKSRIIVLNPQQKKLQNNGNVNTAKKISMTESENKGESPPRAKVTYCSLSSVEVGYKNIRKAGSGMFNVGNTCYLNSTLQALFHTPALYNYLISGAHSSKCTGSLSGNGFIQNCTICALTNTLRDTLRNNVIKPNRVYEKLKHICKHMVHGRQEDAHEFLRYLIESCQRSFLISAQAPKGIDNASKETTPFNQIFGGYMRQDVTCLKCKHVSTTFQHFMDLLLDIRQASNIEEALSQYFRQERIGGNAGDSESNMYKCEKCKIKVQAKKRYLIERPPAVLCIQLKRFSLLGGKISKPVQLHRRINIAPYLQSQNGLSKNGINDSGRNMPSHQGSACEYSLVAMITHVGPSPNCGHYTAIGEAGNGQFYQFDDSSVRQISVGQALNTASYVVFYEMTRSSWRNVSNASSKSLGSNPSIIANGGLSSPTPKVKAPCTITSQTSQGVSANPVNAKPALNMNNKPNGNNANVENKPRIISLGSSIKPAANKLGIVSGAAKTAIAAAATIVRTVTNAASGGNGLSNPNLKNAARNIGLVPYDEDSSDSETTATDCKSTEQKASKNLNSSTKRPLTASPFVPRSVTVNALKSKPSLAPSTKTEPTIQKEAKPLTTSNQPNILQLSSIERKNSSSGVWTVTDADTHNPSVNSDNSTGSTSGNWTIKDNDTNKSIKTTASETESMITVQHSKTSSSWVVKPALSPSTIPLANVKRSEHSSSDKSSGLSKQTTTSMSDSETVHVNGGTNSGSTMTSPSPSVISSGSSCSSSQIKQKQSLASLIGADGDIGSIIAHATGHDTPRKRCNGGNTDDGDTDYDAELDRGRKKKVKKTDSGSGIHQQPSGNSSTSNPFQLAQSNHYNKNDKRSEVGYNKSNGHRSPWQTPRNKSWSHKDHNYQRQRQGLDSTSRNNHRDERRNSFGNNDYKDKKYRNGGYNNDGYRGYTSNSLSYNNREYDYSNNHRDYRDNKPYFKR